MVWEILSLRTDRQTDRQNDIRRLVLILFRGLAFVGIDLDFSNRGVFYLFCMGLKREKAGAFFGTLGLGKRGRDLVFSLDLDIFVLKW